MKYLVKIDGVEVMLDEPRMEALLDLLIGAEKTYEHYAGTRKGDDGGNYNKLIRPFESNDFSVRLMHDGVYAARRMRTEAFDRENGNN